MFMISAPLYLSGKQMGKLQVKSSTNWIRILDHCHDQNAQVDPHHVVLDLTPEDHHGQDSARARGNPFRQTHASWNQK